MNNFAHSVRSYDPEFKKLFNWVEDLASRKKGDSFVIFDVGCGNGRVLSPLTKAAKTLNLRPIGIDLNLESIRQNRENGNECYSPEQLPPLKCDLLILSHVIEHFSPTDLLAFMNHYLNFVAPGGAVLIATPLMSQYFYEDFDHVRPYQPGGILTVFGPDKGQTQFVSEHLLTLEKIWFRKGPYRIVHSPEFFFKRILSWARLFNSVGSLLFWLSKGRIGKLDGWMGVFRYKGIR